jgi:hypothetical protein
VSYGVGVAAPAPDRERAERAHGRGPWPSMSADPQDTKLRLAYRVAQACSTCLMTVG